jgi:hypothetical protein
MDFDNTPDTFTRDEIEYTILRDRGEVIDLPEGAFHMLDGRYVHATRSKELGATVVRKVRVPRHTMVSGYQCNAEIADIVYKLYPEGLFILTKLTLIEQDPLGATKFHDIIFNQLYKQVTKVILATFGISRNDQADQAENFFSDLSHLDFLELFRVIVKQEYNNERTEAILKKVQGVLAERFRLENVAPNSVDSLPEPLRKFLESSLQSSSS